MKKITILGVTGSVGMQAIDVICAHPDQFQATALSAGHNITRLEEVLSKVTVSYVCVMEKKDCLYLQKKYPDIVFVYGTSGLETIATLTEVDIVLNAIVGFAGLQPTISAIKARKNIAIANKETLVVAGHIITSLAKKYNVSLLPVDSEHSAIFQALQGENKKNIKRLLLTASGGSFRNKTREELVGVSVTEALKHPNWSMGAKITIDSATMFNKGLEIIEAKWLFDVSYEQIEVVLHPESIVHSMVEFNDSSIIAQLGNPDMRLPIQYAFTYPERIPALHMERLDITKVGSLHFSTPDTERFPALDLAFQAGKLGGSMPCVLNGANECANQLFLTGKIEFLQIEELVKKAMQAHSVVANPTWEQLVTIDTWARNYILEQIGEKYADNN